MNAFISNKQEIPIASHVKPDGGAWSIKEKLWLGLSRDEYKAQFLRNPVNWALIVIFAVASVGKELRTAPYERKILRRSSNDDAA